MTREGLLQQHCRQLALDAEQLVSTLDQAMGTRVQSLKTIAAIMGTDTNFRTQRAVRTVLNELQSTYPELEWIGFADTSGTIVAATKEKDERLNATTRPWFRRGLRAMWIGELSGELLDLSLIHI